MDTFMQACFTAVSSGLPKICALFYIPQSESAQVTPLPTLTLAGSGPPLKEINGVSFFDPRFHCLRERIRRELRKRSDHYNIQAAPPDFWQYLANIGTAGGRNRERVEELLPLRFKPFEDIHKKQKYSGLACEHISPKPARFFCIQDITKISRGSYRTKIFRIGHLNEAQAGFEKVVYILKKVPTSVEEAKGLKSFCIHFPKKLEASFTNPDGSQIHTSLKFAQHEYVWMDGMYTWELLHAAQGELMSCIYRPPISAVGFDLSNFYQPYRELGYLMGIFFKRYQRVGDAVVSEYSQPLTQEDDLLMRLIFSVGRACFDAPYWDLTGYNIHYDAKKHLFTAFDLSILGKHLDPKNHVPFGVQATIMCILSHYWWVRLFIVTCPHFDIPMKKDINMGNRDMIYNQIRSFYECFLEAFLLSWPHPNDRQQMRCLFSHLFVFPYRDPKNAFYGDALLFKSCLQERLKYYLDPIYPCPKDCANSTSLSVDLLSKQSIE